MTDKNGKELKDGDIIDIHQTVNGRNMFVVMNINPLDIRYAFDLSYYYEYDREELLDARIPYDCEPTFEIVGNINDKENEDG